MLKGVLHGAVVQAVGLWDEENERYGRYVRLAETGNGDHSVKWSIAKEINGKAPAVGEVVDVLFEVRFKPKPSQDGKRAYLRESYRVLAFQPAVAQGA